MAYVQGGHAQVGGWRELRLHAGKRMFIGTYSVTTTLNVHSRSRSFVSALDLRGIEF